MKLLKVFRSMKFGMILLALIVVCSLFGSLIPQGQEAAYYAQQYPGLSGVILALSLDDVFSSWYFLLLLGLLCLNLLFCSVLRLKNTLSARASCIDRAFARECAPISGKDADRIEAFLKARRFKAVERDGQKVYYRNLAGYFGSFITHLGLLLVLLFAAAAMYLSIYEDQVIFPGESYTMADGTVIAVDSFSMGDGEELDYRSVLRVTDRHGAQSGPREISVNYPLSFGGHKYYQQSYGVTGYLTVTNEGVSSPIALENGMFLTLDGENGVRYEALFPDHKTDEDGKITPVDGSDFANPVYLVTVVEDGESSTGVVMPGTTLAVDGVTYTFQDPMYFPQIRIKTVPAAAMALLYTSFALLVAGLYLCFFHVPAFVTVGRKGYAISGPKADVSLAAEINNLRRTQC